VFTGKLARAFWLFCLLLLVALVWFYYPWLSGAQAFYQSDLTYYFEPFCRFISDSFREGRLRLWNPYLYCGMAQVAVPSPGIFYPPIAFFMLPFSQGMAAFLVFHQLIAGAGAFLLAATLGWGLIAALVAGFGVALCGYMFALQANFTLVASVSWLPLLLFALFKIDGTFTRSNVAWMFLSCVAMSMMVGAGRPELSVPGALIAGVFAVLCSGRQPASSAGDRTALPCSGGRQPAFLAILLRLVSMFLGVLLAAPVLFPALEWARVSPRAHGLELKWVLMWSANWYDIVCLVCAQPFGDLTRLGNSFLNMVASRHNSIPYVTSSYVGPIIFTLAIWSLFKRGDRWNWGILAGGLALLVMAAGSNTPIAAAVCGVSPVFAAFRYPVKLMIFPALALVMLASSGACLAATRNVPKSAQITTLALWLLVAVVGCVFSYGPSFASVTLLFPWNAAEHIDLVLMHKAQVVFGESLIVAAEIGLFMSALYFLYNVGKIQRVAFGAVLVLALIGNLLWPALWFDRHGTVADFYDRSSPLTQKVLDQLHDHPSRGAQAATLQIPHRALTLYFDPLTPGPFFIPGQKLKFQEGFYLYARHLMLPNNNVDFRVPYSFGYEAAEVGNYKTWFSAALGVSTQNRQLDAKAMRSDAPIARFCKYTAATVVLTQQYRHERSNLLPRLEPQYFDLVSDDETMNVRMYTPKQTLPRAYFAQSIKKADWVAFYKRMLDFKDPTIPTDTFVEDDALVNAFGNSQVSAGGSPLSRAGSPRSAVAAGGSALTEGIAFVTDDTDRVTIKTSRPTPGLFVLTDQFYPGWFATMDGVPTKIYRINHFARGVMVPAGTHHIDFRYSPASVNDGFLCSFLSLFLFIVAFIFAAMRPRTGSQEKRPQSLSTPML